MKSRLLINIVLGLVLLAATASLAQTQVKMVTFGSGLGNATSAGHKTRVLIGPPFAGHYTAGIAESEVYFGFWYLRNEAVSATGEELQPMVNKLYTNYPNPFNPSTTIGFSLEKEARVRVEVFDLRGRRVDSVFEGIKPAGRHSLQYQPRHLASGSYVILMRAGSFRATQRMTLIK